MMKFLLICHLASTPLIPSENFWCSPSSDPQDGIMTIETPYQDGIANYLDFLNQAKESVYIAAYSFTEPSITDKLLSLKEKGVSIHIILDKSQSSNKAEQAQISKLKAANIEVLIGSSSKGRIMHNKFTVLDHNLCESGSFNYSKAANDEANLLDFISSKDRAELLLKFWNHMATDIENKEKGK